MQITNANVLMTQLNAGANVVMSGNQLKTQNSFEAFFQNIGDLFRSNASIAARNNDLAVAMANMLRGDQGPQNLTAIPTATQAERQTNILNAKTTIVTNLIHSGIDAAYADRVPEVRTAMKEYCAQIMKGDANRAAIGESKDTADLRAMADNILDIFDDRLNSVSDLTLKCNLEKFDPMRRTTAESTELMTSLQDILSHNCSQDRSHLNHSKQRNFDNDGFYAIASLDFPRDHPMIDGQIIDDQFAGKQALLNFCENKDEMEVLSMLMTQTALAPLIDIISDPQYGISSGFGTVLSGIKALPGVPRFTLSRMENGDARIEVATLRIINGPFSGISLSERPIGKVTYDVIVPHAQFATGLLPSQPHDIRVQNMQFTALND